MAKVTIDSGRRIFTNLKALIFTPWKDEATLGDTDYDLINIVGDSTSVEQGDPETNAIEHEFSSEPLYETVTPGSKTFTTECVDYQNEALEALFGWEVDDEGNAYAPTSVKDLYCKIEMHFNSTEDIIVLPKVKMNSKAVLASMKTDVSRGNIGGSCYSAYVNGKDTDMAVIASANKGSYTVKSTPEP